MRSQILKSFLSTAALIILSSSLYLSTAEAAPCLPGEKKCPDGRCVTNDPVWGRDNCKCKPTCNPCTQACAKPAGMSKFVCVDNATGMKECPDGTCVHESAHCPEECGPDCKEEDCKYCKVDQFGARCVPVPMSSPCDGGGCDGFSTDDKCPEDCTPKCKDCVERCALSALGHKWGCEPNGNHLCPDGRCVGPYDLCEPWPTQSPTLAPSY